MVCADERYNIHVCDIGAEKQLATIAVQSILYCETTIILAENVCQYVRNRSNRSGYEIIYIPMYTVYYFNNWIR